MCNAEDEWAANGVLIHAVKSCWVGVRAVAGLRWHPGLWSRVGAIFFRVWHYRLTPLGSQSRFGGELLEIRVVAPKTGLQL